MYPLISRFNEQVKNNIEKLDEDFMFQLSKEELAILMSKNRYQVGVGVENCREHLQSKAFTC